jgi:hypothetical protein
MREEAELTALIAALWAAGTNNSPEKALDWAAELLTQARRRFPQHDVREAN